MSFPYLAGLIDSEGSIMLLGQGPRRSRRPQICVAMKDTAPLDYLKSEFGGFRRDGPGIPKWCVNGKPAVALLEEALPYLVIERRRDLASALIERYPFGDQQRYQRVEALFQEMRKRNQRRLKAAPKMEFVGASQRDFEYAAGILDGEGWINDGPKRGNSSFAEVWSTDPELCSWLRSRFKGNVYVRPATGNRRKCWSWRANREAIDLLAPCSEHMLIDRKRTALEHWA